MVSTSYLVKNFRILFIFCVIVDIGEVLLLEKIRTNKGLILLELFSFVIHEKAFWFLLLILLNNFRDHFLLCINVDTDELLLLDENKGLGVNSFSAISLCNS